MLRIVTCTRKRKYSCFLGNYKWVNCYQSDMPISWQMNDPYALHQLLNSKIENNSIFLRHKRREEITRDWRISWHKSHKVRNWGIRRHCPTAASAKCRNSLVAQPMVWFHAKPLALEPISLLLALEPISLFFFSARMHWNLSAQIVKLVLDYLAKSSHILP